MVLDPHRAFIEHPGGISINIVEQDGMFAKKASTRRFKGVNLQFGLATFCGIFEFDAHGEDNTWVYGYLRTNSSRRIGMRWSVDSSP